MESTRSIAFHDPVGLPPFHDCTLLPQDRRSFYRTAFGVLVEPQLLHEDQAATTMGTSI